MFRSLVIALTLVAASTACARTLPDQDRRIVSAATDAPMSADILSKGFQSNKSEAARPKCSTTGSFARRNA